MKISWIAVYINMIIMINNIEMQLQKCYVFVLMCKLHTVYKWFHM